jgi:predicted flavoprotein YhiN
MAQQIKALQIKLDGFRPIEEAISCAGGIKQQALSESLNLKEISGVFCCGEMLDWDAPTGGYLLTACFATGRAAGEGVRSFLER